MPWPGQAPDRRGIPKALAEAIHARDHSVCHICGHPGADQIDHKVNVKHPDAPTDVDHPDNLAPIHATPCPTCGIPCHHLKTAQEAQRTRAQALALTRYPTPPHPSQR